MIVLLHVMPYWNTTDVDYKKKIGEVSLDHGCTTEGNPP